ncbi:glycosyltransferase, partial [Alphaproteobacteria bacterium]|nr:glycosyltransferase [Alphaproteobacteria bacterium]
MDKTTAPKVTIVVPVYNTSRDLEQCLCSILDQTFKDFELIAVNDCSTDQSAGILEVYGAADPRIRVVHHTENLGLPSTRNTGVSLAMGKYVIHLDSDDFWASTDALKLLYETAEIDGCEMLRFNGQFLRDETPAERLVPHVNLINVRLKETAVLWQFRCVYLYMFRKDFLEKHQLDFDPTLSIGEDGIFLSKALTRAKKVSSIKANIYRYRVATGSIMTRKWKLKDFLEESDSYATIHENLSEFKDVQTTLLVSRTSGYLPLVLVYRALSDLSKIERTLYYERLNQKLREYSKQQFDQKIHTHAAGTLFQLLLKDKLWTLLDIYISTLQFVVVPASNLRRLLRRSRSKLHSVHLRSKKIAYGQLAKLRLMFPGNRRALTFINKEENANFNFKLTEGDKKPGFSTMLRVKNEENNILECLESIADVFDEIVVVDNASQDQTADLVEKFRLTHNQGHKIKLHSYPFDVA